MPLLDGVRISLPQQMSDYIIAITLLKFKELFLILPLFCPFSALICLYGARGFYRHGPARAVLSRVSLTGG